ncbi:MAG: hypothetical protein H7Y32_10440, partial [Chloroflexales bacterium]|nr:hypothetical protein [Chloroflexales bacterium]
MTHDDRHVPASAPDTLADPALLRYLSPQLAAELAEHPSSLGVALEALVHLASTRHTIGTYLPCGASRRGEQRLRAPRAATTGARPVRRRAAAKGSAAARGRRACLARWRE